MPELLEGSKKTRTILLLSDRKYLIQWAMTKTQVGVCRSSYDCPIAQFLHENGVPDARVWFQNVTFEDGSWVEMPEWAQSLIAMIDQKSEQGDDPIISTHELFQLISLIK